MHQTRQDKTRHLSPFTGTLRSSQRPGSFTGAGFSVICVVKKDSTPRLVKFSSAAEIRLFLNDRTSVNTDDCRHSLICTLLLLFLLLLMLLPESAGMH